MKPVLVRQHEEMTPPGLLVEWLEERGIPYEVHHSYKGEASSRPVGLRVRGLARLPVWPERHARAVESWMSWD